MDGGHAADGASTVASALVSRDGHTSRRADFSRRCTVQESGGHVLRFLPARERAAEGEAAKPTVRPLADAGHAG